MIYNEPIFFNKNRVFRVYTGGRLLGEFVNDNSEDDFFPEEWIASPVEAGNNRGVASEGISVIKDTNILLTELIKQYPGEILGSKKEIGILVKFLDSAIRLPVQAHPDKEFSMKYFCSAHGKEESWIVLATRPGAAVYFGFKKGITAERFQAAIDKSKTDKNAMEALLVRHEVKPGDVIFVPARTVHAIGAGCLMLEIQEPTDFTVQPEHFCGDYELSDNEMYLGLTREQAVSCFDFNEAPNVFITPRITEASAGVKKESLIDGACSDNFAVNRITLNNGEYRLEKSAGIYVVIDGCGKVTGDKYCLPLKRGDFFLLPNSAAGKFTVSGNIKIAECSSV